MKNLQELSNEELLTTNGGTGFWYDVAYVVGTAAHSVAHALESAADTISTHPVGGPRGGYN